MYKHHTSYHEHVSALRSTVSRMAMWVGLGHPVDRRLLPRGYRAPHYGANANKLSADGIIMGANCLHTAFGQLGESVAGATEALSALGEQFEHSHARYLS